MEILSLRHAYPEAPPFTIHRPQGLKSYTFLHFFSSVEILVGEEKIQTRPHACIFYSPDTPQWFFSSVPVVHDWAHYDSSFGTSLKKYGISENTIYYPKDTGFITEIFREIESELFSDNLFRDERMTSKTVDFLIGFIRNLSGEMFSTKASETEVYQDIRKKIFMNLSHRWTVTEMAALANISNSRFHVRYKSIFGISPLNDLIEARINMAKNRLLSDPSPICRISDSLGYNNPYHFIRQFKKIVGCSPSKYRKHCSSVK